MNTRTITALEYNDRSQLDFATNEPQKTVFREMVKELERQTGENWSEYLQEVEVEEDIDTGNITTEAGNIFAPNSDRGESNYRFLCQQVQPTTTQNP